MPVKALYDYDFPSADRQENFGDDQLVYVYWENNPMMSAPAAFRAPRTIGFGDFVSQIVAPWAGSDPDFEAWKMTDWRLFDADLDVSDPDVTLADLGVGHKGLLRFRTRK